MQYECYHYNDDNRTFPLPPEMLDAYHWIYHWEHFNVSVSPEEIVSSGETEFTSAFHLSGLGNEWFST